MKNFKRARFLILGIVAFLFLSACTDTAEPEEEITLYVQAHELGFMQEYGYPYEMKHGNIQIVPLSYGYEGEHEPDILFMNHDIMDEAIDEQILAPLEPFMSQNPEMFEDTPFEQKKGLEIVRSINEQMYGLPMNVNSHALYYNIDLFDAFDVPYPTNFMRWEEIFQLAQQFPTMDSSGSSLYGLGYYPNRVTRSTSVPLYYLSLLSSKDLFYGTIHWDNETIRIADDEHIINRWSDMVSVLNSEHIRTESKRDREPHPISLGNVAMAEGMERDALELSNVNWGVVTYPLAPDGSGSNMYGLTSVYGIHEDSNEKEAAWDFIKYIYENREIVDEIDGRSLSPFYLLDYEPVDLPDDLNLVLYTRLLTIVSNSLNAVFEDGVEMKEAFEAMKTDSEPLIQSYLMGEEVPSFTPEEIGIQ